MWKKSLLLKSFEMSYQVADKESAGKVVELLNLLITLIHFLAFFYRLDYFFAWDDCITAS